MNINHMDQEEHDFDLNAKKVSLVNGQAWPDPKGYIGLVTVTGNVSFSGTATVVNVALSYYNQSSLVSGYVYHGFANPGSNPTQSLWRIQREVLNTGEVTFGGMAATFLHQWSAASLASLSY